jgi:hypothetical protein
MKKMLIVLAMVFMFYGVALADSPFMISASVPGGSWDKIEMVLDGGSPVLLDPFTKADGTQILQYDCVNLAIGNHTATLRGKKGVWFSPTPFVFTFGRPSVPNVSGAALSESPQQ